MNDLDLSRIFLLSSDHINQPGFFKNYDAIRMTEVLEYSKSLNGTTLPHFQVYKLSFALEMADLGKSELAAEYLMAIQSILSDYKGSHAEKYTVLSEVVDEVCDRQSVHFSSGASISNKHAGWFTKGLDSLMSAAVGETLDSTDVKKKSRKYSHSNINDSGSDMARISSAPLPDVAITKQPLMVSKSESVSNGGNSAAPNNINHFHLQNSDKRNYNASYSNSGNNHFSSFNDDQTQHFNLTGNSIYAQSQVSTNSVPNKHPDSHHGKFPSEMTRSSIGSRPGGAHLQANSDLPHHFNSDNTLNQMNGSHFGSGIRGQTSYNAPQHLYQETIPHQMNGHLNGESPHLQKNNNATQRFNQVNIPNIMANSQNRPGQVNGHLQNSNATNQYLNQANIPIDSGSFQNVLGNNDHYSSSSVVSKELTNPPQIVHSNPVGNVSPSPYDDDASRSKYSNNYQLNNGSYSLNSSTGIHKAESMETQLDPRASANSHSSADENTQVKPQSEAASNKNEDKKTSASNGTNNSLLIPIAPASKSLVNSLWGSLSLFGKSSKDNNAENSGPIKAKLGQELNCYFDDATGKWVFPDSPQTAEAAPLPPPPQTKAPPPTQNNSAATSRQPSPAPSGTVSPAPLSSTPKPTYIGALGGSSRANRRSARSKYVDVLNPQSQANDIQPSFDFSPVNNFANAEPKIMKVFI